MSTSLESVSEPSLVDPVAPVRVLIYGLNFAPEPTGVGRYTGELAMEMASTGSFEVRVITAPPYYPAWRISRGYRKSYSIERGQSICVYRTPLYIPGSLSGLTRILHLMSFAISSAPVLLYCAIRYRPHVVIAVMPTFLCSIAALFGARISRAKALLHVQDLEIDAFFSLGSGVSAQLRKVAGVVESYVMCRFDIVTTISHTMRERIVRKGVGQNVVSLFPNWVDISRFDPQRIAVDDPFGSQLRSRCQVHEGARVVLYSGNIGEKQGLDLVLDAAHDLLHRTDIVFLIVGDGARKESLVAEAQDRGLHNTRFHPLVSMDELPALLAEAELHLVLQKVGMADLVMPSKLGPILAMGGRCLVMAERHSELELLSSAHPGLLRFASVEDNIPLARVIEAELDSSSSTCSAAGRMRTAASSVPRRYAVDQLDRNAILPRFFQLVRQLAAD